ncbi:MAG: TetR/AcrR family transcriptional regulator [Lachnospiraceae bacterium]|nr:TetR/AcrR family transcriptional regulator [Lachnospiraceae bacterium]
MKKGEKTRLELAAIAYRLFITNGYESTSVDEIIKTAGIAKGTFYYHFDSKEQLLEEVIGLMIASGSEKAKAILASDASGPEKIVGIILAYRPVEEELLIRDELNKPENSILHERMNEKLREDIVPILSKVVKEGIKEGVFHCDSIPERIRAILVLSSNLFDEGQFTKKDISVFIDIIEKTLGAKPGTMGFIRKLVG